MADMTGGSNRLALVMAVPVGLLAARNICPFTLLNLFAKLILVSSRSVNSLVWALLFVGIFGPGALAGTLAIAFRLFWLQVVRHQALHAIVDAQVLARIEQQLKTQHVIAVALEQRRPRNRPRRRQFDAGVAKQRLHRGTIEASENKTPRRMQHRKNRFVTIRHHRGYEHAARCWNNGLRNGQLP